jgi:chromosome segregation ATPase
VDTALLRKDLSDARTELAALKAEHARAVTDLAALNARYEGQKQSHETLGLAIADKDRQITSLKRDVADRDEVIAQLRDSQASLRTDLDTLGRQRDALQSLLTKKLMELDDCQKTIARLETLIKQMPVAPPPLPESPPQP